MYKGKHRSEAPTLRPGIPVTAWVTAGSVTAAAVALVTMPGGWDPVVAAQSVSLTLQQVMDWFTAWAGDWFPASLLVAGPLINPFRDRHF